MKKILNFIKIKSRFLIAGLLCISASPGWSQPVTVDKIVAVVGDKPILLSDIEAQAYQIESQSGVKDPDLRCRILEETVIQKLLMNQAEKDSVTVGDDLVDNELNKKIRFFVSQIGSVEQLEAYLGKSITEIKEEFRERIREQLTVQQMQSKIAGEVKVSPSEVKAFFNTIPADSVPFIESEVKVAQLLSKPSISLAEKDRVRAELAEIKQKILSGKSFASMAAFYSQDAVSAAKGGELGFVNRGDLVPEFEAAAFALKGTEISDIVETMYGFHIIQLIERRGEMINVRHILLSPKASPEELEKCRLRLDSIQQAIRLGEISFDEAAAKFSDDDDTKNNGGLLINPASGSNSWEVSQLDQSVFFAIDKLKVGEMSDPVPLREGEKKTAYRVLMLKERTEPHKANLKDDYQRILQAAEAAKREKLVNEWIHRKRQGFFINIDPLYDNCVFENDWKQP
ncbi:MAG: peptidylprolyl isomerase [Bacteroidetes bacterium]|nr:peptidylprolyl isomerase [Bacteroidota bacterium]